MARKKLAEAQKERKQEPAKEFVGAQEELPPAVDPVNDTDASAKLEALRSLNTILLNKEVSRRQEVESLLLSNESLERELGQAKSQVEGLISDLDDKIIEIDVLENVLSVYLNSETGEQSMLIQNLIEILEKEAQELKILNEVNENTMVQLNTKIDEIEESLRNERNFSSEVIGERDGTRETLVSKTEKLEKLRQKVSVLEAENRELQGNIEELKKTCDRATRSNKNREMRIVSLTNERDTLKESLVEANNLIGELKGEISNAITEKRRIEELKDAAVKENESLEKGFRERVEMVNELMRHEKELLASVEEMKKKSSKSDTKFKEMMSEINQLQAEKVLAEDMAKKLSKSKTATEMELGKAEEQLSAEEDKVEKLVHEKAMLLEANARLDGQVGELRNREVEQRELVSKLEESCKGNAESIKTLESEIDSYRCKFEGLESERNDLKTCLDVEKQNVSELKKKIDDLMAEIKQHIQDAGKVEASRNAIFAEKEELKMQLENLKMELRSMENKVNAARNEAESMKSKAEMADARAKMILNMLKNTAAYCRKEGTDDFDLHFSVNDAELRPFAVEMEMIIDIFRTEEMKAEEMGRKLESLKTCVDRAQKKSSLWAMLSSATSVMAAFAFAFAAKRLAC